MSVDDRTDVNARPQRSNRDNRPMHVSNSVRLYGRIGHNAFIDYPQQVASRSPIRDSAFQSEVGLLMHAREQSGVAGILADGVQEWIHSDESHREAVVIERALERGEGVVELLEAKIVNANLVIVAGLG